MCILHPLPNFENEAFLLSRQDWYTSGKLDTVASSMGNGSKFMWESNGESIQPSLASLWLDPVNSTTPKGVIIYKYGSEYNSSKLKLLNCEFAN